MCELMRLGKLWGAAVWVTAKIYLICDSQGLLLTVNLSVG